MKNIFGILLAAAAMLLVACSNEVEGIKPESQKKQDLTVVPLRFEGSIEHFDKQTRAVSSDWDDSTHLYIQFYTVGKRVNGIATYSKSTNEWKIQYDGTVNEGQVSSCEIYYFEVPDSTFSSSIVLSAQSSVFADSQATYIYEDGVVMVYAHLKPLTGRIRFHGTKGQNIKVSGLKYYTKYDITKNTLSEKAQDLHLTIADNGYTPYVYSRFSESSLSQLSLENGTDEMIFRKTFDNDILAAGLSGYLDIPTESSHAGWLAIEYEPDTLGLCPNANHPHMIDMGLGLKWACCNVGAKSPIEYGDYFAWGETSSKLNYEWSTYRWCNGSENTITKYCLQTSSGTVDGKTELDYEDDAARVNWGNPWRTPLSGEMSSFKSSIFKREWVKIGGIKGVKITAMNGNCIFLPAAGNRSGSSYESLNNIGRYWTSSLSDSNRAYYLFIYYSSQNLHFIVSIKDDYGSSQGLRYIGHCVRPVTEQ